MKPFLKENLALVVGITLPLALIAAFFLVGQATVMSVAAPQYDAIFGANYRPHSRHYPYRIHIEDGKITVRVSPAKKRIPYTEPFLYVFDRRALYVKKIVIDFTKVVDGRVQDPNLDILNRKRIDSGPMSSDGYVFSRIRRGRRGLFAGLFGSRWSSGINNMLVKGARHVPVAGAERHPYLQFIGWVSK